MPIGTPVLAPNEVTDSRTCGGVWAPTIGATPAADMPAALRRAWDALIPNGALGASFVFGDGTSVVDGRSTTRATQEQVVDWMAGLPSLGPIEMWEVEHETVEGAQRWLHVRAVRQPKLVTGGDNPFLPQLRAAIRDAVEIDLAVAFIKTTGLRLLLPDLQEALASTKVKRLRIVTSDYLDLTDPEALRLLMLLQQEGATVRVYEAGVRSFHMKAYLFAHFRAQRDDVEPALHGTAFIGSSNISRQALTEGLEWNYRVEYPNDDGFLEARSRFEDVFSHPRTRPLTDEWIDAYQARRQIQAFVAEAGADEKEPPPLPTPVQALALQALRNTRDNGARRGLVVLATGLGKTWLAAFDAEQMRAKRVLFVAHREEILSQAASTFLRIRPTARVGFYIGQQRDTNADVLCASVQTLGKDAHLQRFAHDHFDFIVVDEFHHAAAPTYQRLLQHFAPQFLLGLTATPDRSDHSDILSLCDDNLVFSRGLLDGVHEKLLVPFHYFGIDDDTVDYREIPWRNGRFDPTELSNKLTTTARAEHALSTWKEHHQQRTLAFCVSTRHADFMAQHFRQAGVRAVAVYGGSTMSRGDALDQLREGRLDVVFSVDLFNEGVDLPLIDTVMMLRPTESKILFLQQLGRGLRRAPGKLHLVVLDFIGNHMSFLHKPQALFGLGTSYREIAAFARNLESNDVVLPDGCRVNYDLTLLDFLRSLDSNTSVDEYDALKEALGRRPTLTEFYRSGASVSTMRDQHGGWFALVHERGDLGAAELAALETARALIDEVETVSVARCEVMVFLKAFCELDGWHVQADEAALAARGWEIFIRRPRLRGELPVGVRHDDGWLEHWRKETSTWFERRASFTLEQGHVVSSEVGGEIGALVDELVDYRLASYEARRAATNAPVATTPTAAASSVNLDVVREETNEVTPHRLANVDGSLSATTHVLFARGAPERVWLVQRNATIAEGDIVVARAALDGPARRWRFDQGLYRSLDDDSEATAPHVLGRCERELDPLTLHVGESFMREAIPPLFGETFNPGNWQAGQVSLSQGRTVLLVTVNKQGKSAAHRYVDHWSEDRRRFYWQSQNGISPTTKKGRDVIEHAARGGTLYLFVREQKLEGKKAAAFIYAGRVRYREHSGSKPMNVTFDLLD